MELLSMVPRPVGEAEDGVEADAAQPAGGPHAGALRQVLGDGQGLLLGELGAEQGRAGPLGEALAAGGAAEAADAPLLAGPAVGAEVASAPLAVGGAGRGRAGRGGPVALAHDTLPARPPHPNSLPNQGFWRKADGVTTDLRRAHRRPGRPEQGRGDRPEHATAPGVDLPGAVRLLLLRLLRGDLLQLGADQLRPDALQRPGADAG